MQRHDMGKHIGTSAAMPQVPMHKHLMELEHSHFHLTASPGVPKHLRPTDLFSGSLMAILR